MSARHKIIISTIKNSSILHRLPPVTRIHEVAREMSQMSTIFVVLNLPPRNDGRSDYSLCPLGRTRVDSRQYSLVSFLAP
jgi:hypothetical protein